MDKRTRELFEVTLSETQSRVLASTADGISVEIVEHLGEADFGQIVKISETLVDNFGQNARFNRNSVKKYFNYPKTLPFVIRYKGEIEGFIVGVPLEYFSKESWAQCDENLSQNNTVYTYAYIVRKERRVLGLSKILKRVYQNTLKRRGYKYITGHVMQGVTANFTRNYYIVRQFDNWNNTGFTFEYYRSALK
ncbi:MAG: hypothetical protein M0R34_05625 [Candidatus Marinimicrobia bacterium]|jgi:hypothetical protein|nr:hypothetical protein [Candidatus Neomarinimicrobiota bacterium]MCK9559889.1 hypothetical protein [Candidatus Neomarinimicrobiota bacterium]MDD5061928.1 hypothetical protein [Candidatus Neomarinimicrobiota bacterium]MDD5230667.1 hypothetical protein [Candidatus Neomarinimicrobiota bacterium]